MNLKYISHRINEILDNHIKLINMLPHLHNVIKENLINDVSDIRKFLNKAKQPEEKTEACPLSSG